MDINTPDPINCYNPEITIDASNSQTGINIIYNWFDGFNNLILNQNGNTLDVSTEGFYYLQLVDTLNGCENIDSVFIENLQQIPLSQGIEDVNLFCGCLLYTSPSPRD